MNTLDRIELDKDEILNAVHNSGSYSQDGVFIRKWDAEGEEDLFLGKITKPNMSYMGVLDGQFHRHNYGLNTFENGDKYFGYFNSNARSRHGAYIWSPQERNGKVQIELYHGFWRDNQKDNHGIYLWLTEEKGNRNFDNSNFEAFVGDLEMDQYRRGCYLTKVDDHYYVYYGNFDGNGKKNDEKSFFFNAKTEQLLYGNMKNDHFAEGYVIFFNQNDGTISDMVYCVFGEDKSLVKCKPYEEIEDSVRKSVSTEVNNFRAIIFGEDYFGKIYSTYLELVDFISEDMKTLSVFDDPQKYPKMMDISTSYNGITIYRDLEKTINS